MKKRYLALAGILVLSLAAAGCGKEKEEAKEQLPVTVAPAEEEEKTEEPELVDMQTSTDEDIKNVMGVKSATASKLILINKTGSEIAAIYIRENTDDDDEWGEDLVDGMFTLNNGDKALYYYEKGTASLYDIRITYKDEDKNECFFRKLPLNNITQISLCMDGEGEDAIPYATYLSGNSKNEVSTLKEVKQRLGLSDDEDSDSDGDDENDQDTDNENSAQSPEPTEAPQATSAPEPTQDPGEEEPAEEPDPGASNAENYIGQPLENLVGACGEPNGSDYENEPESGETGYHYYDTFTVSTTVDENGNEVVAGVW